MQKIKATKNVAFIAFLPIRVSLYALPLSIYVAAKELLIFEPPKIYLRCLRLIGDFEFSLLECGFAAYF